MVSEAALLTVQGYSVSVVRQEDLEVVVVGLEQPVEEIADALPGSKAPALVCSVSELDPIVGTYAVRTDQDGIHEVVDDAEG